MILPFHSINDEPKLLKKQKSSLRGRIIFEIFETVKNLFIDFFYKKYKIFPIIS